jgi:hypothetical protein
MKNKEELIHSLVMFQIYLNDKGLIDDYNWDFEQEAEKFYNYSNKKANAVMIKNKLREVKFNLDSGKITTKDQMLLAINELIETEKEFAVDVLNNLRSKRKEPVQYLWEDHYNKAINESIKEIMEQRERHERATDTVKKD